MNQEQNNSHSSNFNNQWNNGIPLDNQNTNINQQQDNQININQFTNNTLNNRNIDAKNFNKKTKKKPKIFLILGLIIILAIAIALYVLFSPENKKENDIPLSDYYEIYANVYLLSKEEGGRHTPLFDGYSGVISINNGENISAKSYIVESKIIDNKQYYLLRIETKDPISYNDSDSIDIYEGGKLSGIGEIVKKSSPLNTNVTKLSTNSCSLSDAKTKIHVNTVLNGRNALIENHTRKVIIGDKTYYGIIEFEEGTAMLMPNDSGNIYINLCESIDASIKDNIRVMYDGTIIINDEILNIHNK